MDSIELKLRQDYNNAKHAADYAKGQLENYKKFKEGLSDPRLSHTRAQKGSIWMYFRDASSPTGVILHCAVDNEYGVHLLAQSKSCAPLLPKHASYSY